MLEYAERSRLTWSQLFQLHPVPLFGAPYWSDDYLHELGTIQYRLTDAGYLEPSDYQGHWFTVEGHLRRTVGQPSDYEHTIYLYGDSTIFDLYVPDDLTIASQLQKFSRYRVVNMGQPGGSVVSMYERLNTMNDLKSGDIVVFYDGLSDARSIYYVAKNRGLLTPPGLCRIFYFLEGSSLVHIACDEIWIGPELDGIANEVLHNYNTFLDTSRRFVESRGASFYHFLQPTLWSHGNLSPYEQVLESLQTVIAPRLGEVYKRYWSGFQATPKTIDLSDVLTIPHQQGEEFFFDSGHVNDRADAIIAHAIYAHLSLTLVLAH